MGALVVNNNTQAINTHRHLLNTDKRLQTSLEHLSSGERIVRAADGPATLMISERLRAQVAAFGGAIRNSEVSVSMVQTTESALGEVNRLLVDIRRLAVHAANEGANGPAMLEADQQEIENALIAIDNISKFANFAGRKILDGSSGVNGVAVGDNLRFIKGSVNTNASPEGGYGVFVQKAATRAHHTAPKVFTDEDLGANVRVTIEESGRIADLVPLEKDTPQTFVNRLGKQAEERGLNVEVSLTDDGRIKVSHKDYGSKESFSVSSSVGGVLGEDNKTPLTIQNGQDVLATIGGEPTYGVGRLIKGVPGAKTDGIQMIYDGHKEDQLVGRVLLAQHSALFQTGPDVGQITKVALNSVNTGVLGRNVDNVSGYRALADIDVRSFQGAEDAMRLVEKAIEDLNAVRGELGAIQKNSLEANIRSLRINREELLSAESVIRDADMAEEVSEFTRNKVILQSGLSMLTQANQTTQNVLGLLQGI